MQAWTKLAWGICAAVVLLAQPAFAQKISAAERQQQLSKLVEDINSPDPALRVATFEAAIASNDRTIRRMAIEQGLNSKDQIMRETALLRAMEGRRSMILDLSATASPKPWEPAAIDAVGGRLEVYVFDFNASTGQFGSATPYSSGDLRNDVVFFNTGSAAVSGDRISFSFDTQRVSTRQPQWVFRTTTKNGDQGDFGMSACTGNLRLAAGAQLQGTLTCQSQGGTSFTFKAAFNALN